MDLPVLDISQPNNKVAGDLVNAVCQYGFVYVKNHGLGLSAQEIDAMFAISKEFFKTPLDTKLPYKVGSTKSGGNSGWFGLNGENLDPARHKRGDYKEAFNLNEFRDGKAQQPLPPVLASYESEMNDFVTKCRQICVKILELFAIGLNIDSSAGGKDWFAQRHDPSKGTSGSVFRLLYYPAISTSSDYDGEKDIRAGAHSDYGTITLLFQRPGQPGLEISTDDNQEQWDSVPINPTSEDDLPILVNIGDLLSFWTNGLFKSTVHRVIVPAESQGEDRYSIAYFCHPLDEAVLEPVPSSMVREEHGGLAEHGSTMSAKQHLESRLAATYSVPADKA